MSVKRRCCDVCGKLMTDQQHKYTDFGWYNDDIRVLFTVDFNISTTQDICSDCALKAIKKVARKLRV